MAGGMLLWALPGRNPPPYRPVWITRLVRTGGVLMGTYIMALASLELIRLQLPVDPWAEDAKVARQKAAERGEKMSTWFGPRGYKAVEYSEWKKRVDASMAKAEVANQRAMQASGIYTEIRDNNRRISNRILAELQQSNEREQERALIDLMEVNDSGVTWDVLEPWENLRDETDILVRLMPHTRGVHEEKATMQVGFHSEGSNTQDELADTSVH